MRFPTEEEKIIALGKKMSSGLKANSDIYPNPPGQPYGLVAAEQGTQDGREDAAREGGCPREDSLERVAGRMGKAATREARYSQQDSGRRTHHDGGNSSCVQT